MAPTAAAEERLASPSGPAGWPLHPPVGLPGVPGQRAAVVQAGGLRHGARRHLGGRGGAAGHPGGADHGHTGRGPVDRFLHSLWLLLGDVWFRVRLVLVLC